MRIMIKNSIVFIFASFIIHQYANATKLMIKNNEDYDIVVHENFAWNTVIVNRRANKLVFTKKENLKALTAYEKDSVSSTFKKFKLKQSLVEEFNNLQKLQSKTQTEETFKVNFPDDFDVEVSLRVRR